MVDETVIAATIGFRFNQTAIGAALADRHLKIGLSLSLCVLDIMTDKVALDDVAVIYTGTNFPHSIAAMALNSYGYTYWRTLDRNRLKSVLDTLVATGRIVQLKQKGLEAPNIARGHWALIMPTEEVKVMDEYDGVPLVA